MAKRGAELSRGDARDRAVHALNLTLVGSADQTLQSRLLTGLAVSVPEDPWIAWLAADACVRSGCDRPAAIERLLRTDPDNAMAWLVAVNEEVHNGDLVQADRLLQRATRAHRLDPHWARTSQQLVERLDPVPLPPVCRRLANEIGEDFGLKRPATPQDLLVLHAAVLAGSQLPSLRATLALCPVSRRIAAHRQSTCRSLFGLMADSNELMYQSVGVRGLEVHAPTAAERARWRERRRNLAWLGEQAGAHASTPAHLRLMWEQGEVPVLIAALEAAGRWPAPPGWLPPGFDAR